MVALALSSRIEPLIIDQPEDDIDNRSIDEEVIMVLGRVCSQRQVIVVTHIFRGLADFRCRGGIRETLAHHAA
jgi:ABC-type lipoprotein export system ATPase subunit